MDYKKELDCISSTIMSIQNFDTKNFIFNYKNMVNQIAHFYNRIAKDAKNPQEASEVKYDLPKDNLPRVGQVAYFQIEHSYPKEIFNGHWCLVLNDFGNTMLVIPLTSIKPTSKPVDENIEMEIQIKDFEEDGTSKLKIHQMFCADLMRIDKRKKIYNLETSFEEVKNKIKDSIGL